jgi:large exoprotein involved in heme utilization and adhesion
MRGNINIDTTFLIALPPEGSNGSDIIANAQQGAGGEIDIDAAGIFGIEERRAIREIGLMTLMPVLNLAQPET